VILCNNSITNHQSPITKSQTTILENEKDIFDSFREQSEQLSEAPSTEAWQKLERKLKTTRRPKRTRRPVQMQLVVVSAIIGLLMIMGIVGWMAARQQEQILRSREQFSQLRFLDGEWVFSDGKTTDKINWVLGDSLTLVGEKMLAYDENVLSKMAFTIKNQGRDNLFIYNNKPYALKAVINNTFIFESKKKEEIKIRKSSDKRFTVSFGKGIVFVFRRDEP
jgi:hypothetical protein